MEVEKYEWLLIDEVKDEEPTKEEIMQAIEKHGWTPFYDGCLFYSEEGVAKAVFRTNFWQWDVEDEGDYVFIAVKEQSAKKYAVFRVALAYVVEPDVDDIYFEEELCNH